MAPKTRHKLGISASVLLARRRLRLLRRAPAWQRWLAFCLITYPAPVALMLGVGFWPSLLFDALLFVPCDRLMRQLRLPLPGFIERIAAHGELMRQDALKELRAQG